MPDISMCRNEKCPSKKQCYRYTARPNPFRQSYGNFVYVTLKDGQTKCDYFIDNSKYE